ncbi:hypothetical protein [Mesorhizobium ciceri]|uniref:hypothetical protein n=1 Tax=Mesorhizobium TaxID=68287 RepID=UPI00047D5318|nr:hypothetical protein [Mesorhizobium ciceri]
MYQVNTSSPSGSDWTLLIEAINAETNQPLSELDETALVEMQLQDKSNCVLLSATTADGSIEIPEVGKCQWRFTYTQMGALCPGNTYSYACRMTTAGGTVTLMTGTHAYIDGEFEWR